MYDCNRCGALRSQYCEGRGGGNNIIPAIRTLQIKVPFAYDAEYMYTGGSGVIQVITPMCRKFCEMHALKKSVL